jgi:hypothetical protein
LPVERPKLPDSAAKDPATLARALQTELKRVGCDPGPVDGQWGAKGEEALNEFVRVTKIAVPTDAPSDVALQAVTGQKGRICALKCDQGESEVDGKCVASARPEKKTVGRSRSTGEQHERPAREKSPGLGGLCVGVGRGLGFSLCSK